MPSIRILLLGMQPEDQSWSNTLKSTNTEWQWDTADPGESVHQWLERDAYDVIVCLGKIPADGLDSLALFEQVADRWPDTLRILLADDTNRQTALKSLGRVHQLITKPCEPAAVRNTISNSLNLRRLLTDDNIRSRIAAVETLPSPPKLYQELVSVLQSDTVSIADVAKLISKDVAITARIVRMVNSAFFGVRHRVDNALQAVNLLGLDTVKSLVLTAGVFDSAKEITFPGLSLENIHNQSLAVGTAARHLANAFGLTTKHLEDALLAGMLHKVGLLVLVSEFADELKQAAEIAQSDSLHISEAVSRVLGVSDAEIGAYLLSLWGLPLSILEAVALHTSPSKVPCPMLNVLTAVHLGYALTNDKDNRIRSEEQSIVDRQYLIDLNIESQLSGLRNFCMGAAV